jgi:hypothetical protein
MTLDIHQEPLIKYNCRQKTLTHMQQTTKLQFFLPNRSEKAIGLMQVRPQAKIGTAHQGVGILDAHVRQYRSRFQ